MTAFTKDDLPASIDSLAKLAAWVGIASHSINKDVTIIEGSGSPALAAQFGTYFVQETSTPIVIVRQSIKLSPEYAYGSSKLWTYAQEISSDDLPDEFRQDSGIV